MTSDTSSRPRNTEIGERLRRFRHQRGLSIQEVADRSDLSKGFVSQLERDLTSPSVASLVRVCDVLDIPVGALFEASSSNLVRRDERPPINFGGAHVEEWLLTPAGQRGFRVVEGHIKPGDGSGDETYGLTSRPAWVYVLSGELEISVGDTNVRLEYGDAFAFSSGASHSWRNPATDAEARVLWLITPPATPEVAAVIDRSEL